MQGSTVIVDYGMGNLRSVHRKCRSVGVECLVSGQPEVIQNATRLILPGVGHFGNGVSKLKERGIWEVLNKKVMLENTPILGICLGMQLMAKHSEEGDAEGFGWFDAEVVKFRVSDKLKFKVPQMGWNNAVATRKNVLFDGLNDSAKYYFVHAFHIKCADNDDILATTDYDYKFTSAISKKNIHGVQFHPEKSHEQGELMIKNFLIS